MKPPETRTTRSCLEGSTSITKYTQRVPGKHTLSSRLEDGISITGGGAPGQTHHTQLPGRQYPDNKGLKVPHQYQAFRSILSYFR
ncbi:MAG: hypothetical protein IKP81_01565 [Paludibacteraceae bacterium]|nr:hypothetical protein [Paludibacteraceae bacterium]